MSEYYTPSEEEVASYFDSLSNWGRWGAEDELGTLNYITPAKRVAAAAAVEHGESVGCARQIVREPVKSDVPFPPMHFMMRSGESPGSTGASDFLGLSPHGFTISHVDALCHKFYQGMMYNGFPQNLVRTEGGSSVCSIETMKDGVVTRGVLFDIPRHRGVATLAAGDGVFPEELEEIEQELGFEVSEGDAVLLRTGWPKHRAAEGPDPRAGRFRPGFHAAVLPWLHERKVSVIAADASQDVAPSGYELMLPVHEIAITRMGMILLDACEFEDLAAACDRYNRWTFMYVMAPVRFKGATGSPITPVAIF
jgi:kynurenine formamidase